MPLLDRRSLLGATAGAGDLLVAQPTQAAAVPTTGPNRREASSLERAQVVGRAAAALLVAPRPPRLRLAQAALVTIRRCRPAVKRIAQPWERRCRPAPPRSVRWRNAGAALRPVNPDRVR